MKNPVSIKGILKPKNVVLLVILLFVVVSALVIPKTLEITESPSFCGKNCHIMRPFYDSWRTSSHNDVRCVECHYEPGFIGHLKGKINGLMQFYQYETTEEYSGEFYAKVLDKNCLKCHEKRIYFLNASYMGVNFSHKSHLLKDTRGVVLTCTSCHSMLVIGMKEHRTVTDPSCTRCHPGVAQKQDMGHLVVTSSTCFTCHFRDVPRNASISGCPSCHGAPLKTVDYKGINFKHDVHTDKFSCLTCHVNISTGANDVISKEKCLQCHQVRERLKRYDDFKFIHKNHVTDQKIACYRCHGNVKHKPDVKDNLCVNCHKQKHPENWLQVHSKQVIIGEVCSNCHAPKFCADCHATGIATEVAGQRQKKATFSSKSRWNI